MALRPSYNFVLCILLHQTKLLVRAHYSSLLLISIIWILFSRNRYGSSSGPPEVLRTELNELWKLHLNNDHGIAQWPCSRDFTKINRYLEREDIRHSFFFGRRSKKCGDQWNQTRCRRRVWVITVINLTTIILGFLLLPSYLPICSTNFTPVFRLWFIIRLL